MAWHVKKERVREIPFHDNRPLQFQEGFLVDGAGEKVLRYTRSLETVRARYRITLQFSNDEVHTPYVFDVIRSESDSKLDIRPENEPAQETWLAEKTPHFRDLSRALELIFSQDIEIEEMKDNH